MGKMQRNKGARIEREIVHLHRDAGIRASRVPLSGACEGYKGDLTITMPNLPKLDLRGEVKARKNAAGFKVILGWLGDNDLLFLRQDGEREPHVVMPWRVYIELMGCELTEVGDE